MYISFCRPLNAFLFFTHHHNDTNFEHHRYPKFHIDTSLDQPAFLCDTFTVMIGMKDIVDFEKNKDPESEPGSLQDLRRKSMRAIKFAMDHMEAKPTTTKLHFSVNCHAITQHVNMSLLRLTHQVRVLYGWKQFFTEPPMFGTYICIYSDLFLGSQALKNRTFVTDKCELSVCENGLFSASGQAIFHTLTSSLVHLLLGRLCRQSVTFRR